MVPTTAGMKVRDLQFRFENILAKRGRHYSSYLAFAWRFEADVTAAEKDTAHFQTILRLLGLPEAVELVIEAGEKDLPDRLSKFISDLFEQRATMPGRCLMIGHYAGHATQSDTLVDFIAGLSSSQRFSHERTLGRLMDPLAIPANTDSILILDSYFCNQGIKDSVQPDWSAELVASVGPAKERPSTRSKRARIHGQTFTSRLADEISRQVNYRVTAVSLAEIIGNLRRSIGVMRKPQYQLRVGNVGIQIPNLNRTGLLSNMEATQQPPRQESFSSLAQPASATSLPNIPRPLLPAAGLSVIFQAELLNVNIYSVEIRQLVTWAHSLSRDHEFQLIGVYRIHPRIIISFQGPYYLWVQLSGLRCYSLVHDFLSWNYLSEINSSIRPSPVTPARP